jgi:hypothetical protein
MARVEKAGTPGELGISEARKDRVGQHHRDQPHPGETASITFGHRWHKRPGYSTRSLAENAIFRYKTIVGRGMRSQTFDGQRVEVQLASQILNRMTRLGMPHSYRVT